MDVSIFIGNKRRFWSWILIPLFVRFVLPAAVFTLTTNSLTQFDQERKAQEVLVGMDAEVKLNEELLERYRSDPLVPVPDQLYKTITMINSRYETSLTVKTRAKQVGRNKGKVELYEMTLTGDLPSPEVAADFIADLLGDPLLSFREGMFSQSSRSIDQETPFFLNCNFEKLALESEGVVQ